MGNDKVLSVRLYGEPIGLLEQTPTGKMQFAYLEGASHVLSIGMPIRPEAYNEVQTEAYFGGLLPESEHAKRAIGKHYGINHNNSFSLLKAIGHDCAGAVSLHPVNEPAPKSRNSAIKLTAKVLSEKELHLHIKELPQKPLFIGVDGLRLSLAGAQDKAAVCLIDNEIALATQGCPTTHILKPTIPGYDGIVHNEYFCLKLAKHIGLKTPHVEIRQAKEIPYLLIQRYDRKTENDSVSRIHQEDFCQALGIPSGNKYQNDGGPSLKNCLDLLKETTQPVKDRNKIVDLIIFNYLIGNMDAHGKNFSLLHRVDPMERIKLAPVYDVSCTRVYKGLSQKMAMKIGGYYEPSKSVPRRWEEQCKEMGYSYPELRATLIRQANMILKALQNEKEELIAQEQYHPIIDQISEFIEKHIEKTLKRFEA